MYIKNLLVLMILVQTAYGQLQQKKKPINNDSYKDWAMVGNLSQKNISADGKFYCSLISSQTKGSYYILGSVDGSYKLECPGYSGEFTSNGKYFLFIEAGDKLGVVKAGDHVINHIPGVKEIIVPKNSKDEMAILKFKDKIVLRNFRKGIDLSYADPIKALFDDLGQGLVIQMKDKLIYRNLKSQIDLIIPTDSTTNNIAFSPNGHQIAFTRKHKSQNQILCFDLKYRTTKTYDLDTNLPKDYYTADLTFNFDKVGKRIFFKIKHREETIPDTPSVITSVDIWSYKDAWLQSNQLLEVQDNKERVYSASMNLETKKIVQLESVDSVLVGAPGSDYAIVTKRRNAPEAYWNKSQETGFDLLSLETGRRKTIVHSDRAPIVFLSPNEKYVVWVDTFDFNYYSYSVTDGQKRNLTHHLNNSFARADPNKNEIAYGSIPVWLEDGSFLVSDQYDTWQIYPAGTQLPLNLTGGWGKNYNVNIKPIISSDINGDENLIRQSNGEILFVGMHNTTKLNGFFSLSLGKPNSLRALGQMQPCLYYFPGFTTEPQCPLKVGKSGNYLLMRQTASSAPNIVMTKDFKTFRKITDIQPQREYNWLTTDLLTWRDVNNQQHQGILYKPEDFDSTKKYPIILNYYEDRTNDLHKFLGVGDGYGALDIARYVSNGYLVFVPDILHPTGKASESITNTIVSGANYLATFPWINVKKMGLQGHSYGGYETNVVITRSSLFAAAQSSAGLSDMLREYGDLAFGDKSLQMMCEHGQTNVGGTPWDNLPAYIRESPIYSADKINTPLLLMHNKKDGAVPFGQSVSLFNALRRLNKPVWMLQYDSEGHVIFDMNARIDFTTRQEQFFDYYLKDKPAPIWMVDGIPAKDKGVRSGLALDILGRKP